MHERTPLPPVNEQERPLTAPLEAAAPPPELHHPADVHGGHAEALGAVSIGDILRKENIDLKPAAAMAPSRIGGAFVNARRYEQFVPSVASAITHQHDPAYTPQYPTAAEIKKQHMGARWISGVIGFFSESWATRFDRFLERQAATRITSVARRAIRTVDSVGAVAAPKAQFVAELTQLQARLSGSEVPHEAMAQLVTSFAFDRDPKTKKREETAREQYPLLFKLVGLAGLQSHDIVRQRGRLRAFTPEITKGIEQFLRRQGVAVEDRDGPVPEPKAFSRRLVRRVSPRVFDYIPDRVDRTLTAIYGLLPEDGEHFKEGVYALCKDISTRSRLGKSPRDITHELLGEVRHLLR